MKNYRQLFLFSFLLFLFVTAMARHKNVLTMPAGNSSQQRVLFTQSNEVPDTKIGVAFYNNALHALHAALTN